MLVSLLLLLKCIKNYTNAMNANKQTILTPAQLRFAIAFARYNNSSKAIRLAFPDDSKHWSPEYIRLKGHRMITNDNVNAEIANRKAVMEANATLGAQRIQEIIKDGKEHNALQAAIFSVEQADGKAVQVQNIKSEHVSVIYDLSGGQGGEIPAEVLQALEE